MPKSIFREITPLTEKDCFLIFYRIKKQFDFPIHVHNEYELNFIENAVGAKRIVGDSVEVIGDLDLTLITSPDLEHAWLSNECTSTEVKELTIQFHPDLISENLLARNQFKPIQKLFEKAVNGVSFSKETIIAIKPRLEQLLTEPRSLRSVLHFILILYDLSLSPDIRTLSTDSYHDEAGRYDSRRIEKAMNYMHMHYQETIHLSELAEKVGMTEIAFSRFFKKRSGKTFVNALNDIRLGHVTKMLADTTNSIAEICFACGFNNLSNFNRLFRKKKGCTPKEFRENYRKNRFML